MRTTVTKALRSIGEKRSTHKTPYHDQERGGDVKGIKKNSAHETGKGLTKVKSKRVAAGIAQTRIGEVQI